jgi:hypothetical protein
VSDLLDEFLQAGGGREHCDDHLSNFDHEIPPSLEEDLKRPGTWTAHSAWEFYGYIIWDGEQFVEYVHRYGALVDKVTAPTLRDLHDAVCNKWGWQ